MAMPRSRRKGMLMAAGILTGAAAGFALDATPAANAINALGADLLPRAAAADANALIAPYSIQTALAMTFAGAAGETRAEMARALHFTDDEARLHDAFAALRAALEDIARKTAERAARSRQRGGPSDPVVLTVANRLFGERTFEFRAAFLELVRDRYQAPLQACDFSGNAARETGVINHWVAEQTRRRIQNLVPPNALNEDTRLVLVNAVYLKAPWEKEFSEGATRPLPFRVRGGAPVETPTMTQTLSVGYRREDGVTAIALPYSGGDIHFLILLPDAPDGWKDLESKLTAERLASCARLPAREAKVFLPKFRVAPPLMPLGKALRALGMRRAFDEPPGSADFDRMAPRRPDDYLYVSEVFHKTFLDLDEKGTEAAAATAVVMMRATAIVERPEPVEVRVDRPFLFAIQHRDSGACLFLGRVTDPR